VMGIVFHFDCGYFFRHFSGLRMRVGTIERVAISGKSWMTALKPWPFRF
jgi:hypothetical protein